MAQILILFYVMTIFIYLFLVSTNVDAGIRCRNVYDCPKATYCRAGSHRVQCIKHQCKCVRIFESIDPA
ncbi:putative Late nodulin [Medicago truncatula]|uniref:Nodule Cysteine-Rich (NCR) secreted peptide n=1 Tax=Medicago truncatula TaxID=3880 RepID=G7J0M9_MEDTR|nr:Nodule Cysteine-Rich (NCR) secreted peptide [Medicago truncatula]AFK44886.1 unknown [Medicago truncatula]RHN67772.1 putative Late nodulin [Medicago truncatula]